MYKLIKVFLKAYKQKNRKSFYLDDLEKFLLEKSGGSSNYHQKGGYHSLYKGLERLSQEGFVKPMKTVGYNGKYPPLKLRWSIVEDEIAPRWKSEDILRLSDLLDFSTYIKYPQLQTDREWQFILRIHEFLRNRDRREWASCEERCLELFDNEKFLDPKEEMDNGVMKRLKLSYDDLKMKKYGQMFVYWNRGVRQIKTAIILENHSTFFSYKRAAMEGCDIFGIYPDAIIYGQGKDIISSFSFIHEIADAEMIKVFYFGDMDPEGYMIYKSLKEEYNYINISLQLDAYKKLLDFGKSYPIKKAQNKNIENLNFVIREFAANKYYEVAEKLKRLWDANLRIPQEFITYEYLMRSKKVPTRDKHSRGSV
jgi:5S rRNA maturation endonuclease (ribonuclease M5)